MKIIDAHVHTKTENCEELIEYAVKKIGSERILSGSDVYYPEGRDIPVQIAAIKGAKIKEREKENILYKNAKRILLEGLK